MTARELLMWMAYDRLSPISDFRSDVHAAQISSAVLRSQGAKVDLSDMLITWKINDTDDGEITENDVTAFFEGLIDNQPA
ncbi:DUF4035 domain-containing protein [Pragia fontium]|uniref:phage tail assembly protein T n=1 Tax=Pragia fontium TaxID=82985 RepID=UPI0006494000|nr:DUF4035 domain-containing protein [Pragia fontium]AKJ41555.1 hypothetical protein QQ39_05220 [Pragia fontium]